MEPLRPGAELAGYRIEDELGRGGMGVVYRATQTALDRPVALKVVADELADDPELRERFAHEARIAARVRHPNVVPVYDAREADGRLLLATELINGTDLRTIVRDDGPLEPERAAALVAQVADALDAAHALGLVHRDVKPANVLVERRPDGEHAFLTDFGLTKALDEAHVTRTGATLGTAAYMAPEQVRGERIDARTDVYALGCLLHELLTGGPPFRRENDLALLYAHVNDPPPRPSEQRAGVPEGLDAVVARALAKAPADRFTSAGDLGRAAVKAAEGEDPTGSNRVVARGEAGWDPKADTIVPRSPVGAGGTPVPPAPPAAAEPAVAQKGGRPRWVLPAAGAALVAVAVILIVALSGGGGSNKTAAQSTAGTAGQPSPAQPAQSPQQVAEAWARAMNTGDDAQAASYFAVPSVASYNDIHHGAMQLKSRAAVISFLNGLGCHLSNPRAVPADKQGAGAVLLLGAQDGSRQGHTGCSKKFQGNTTYAITVKDGKIVSWAYA